jgi:hypothetical protein
MPNPKPISFTAALVPAILDGRKTVTRRLHNEGDPIRLQSGETLYLTETHWAFGHWEHVQKKGRLGWQFACDAPDDIRFIGPLNSLASMDKTWPAVPTWYKRNARFMPRAYARTFVLIKDVRVERVQDISEADAIREGLEYHDTWLPQWRGSTGLPWRSEFPRDAFADLWDSLHTSPGTTWADNPFVVRIEFERLNHD